MSVIRNYLVNICSLCSYRNLESSHSMAQHILRPLSQWLCLMWNPENVWCSKQKAIAFRLLSHTTQANTYLQYKLGTSHGLVSRQLSALNENRPMNIKLYINCGKFSANLIPENYWIVSWKPLPMQMHQCCINEPRTLQVSQHTVSFQSTGCLCVWIGIIEYSSAARPARLAICMCGETTIQSIQTDMSDVY